MGGKRDEYVENVKSQLDEWNARLERLEEDARLVRDEGRREYEQRIAQLRAKTEEYKKRLTEVQSASESAWDALREGLEEAARELKTAFKETESFTEGQQGSRPPTGG